MKIDQDLRIAIRSAEKAQPSTDWSVRDAQNQKCIEEFMQRRPAKAAEINRHVLTIAKAEAAEKKARAALCEGFGLRHDGTKLSFSNCGGGSVAFLKAGGKLPPTQGRRWAFDTVMAELAAADAKQATAILKKYGINWK